MVFVLIPLGLNFVMQRVITNNIVVENAVEILYMLAVVVLMGLLSSMEIFTILQQVVSPTRRL